MKCTSFGYLAATILGGGAAFSQSVMADAGYWFGEHFGFDAAFLHLGELTYRVAETLKTSTGDEPIDTAATVSSRGPAIALLGRLPLTDALEVDMRVGDYLGKSTRTTRLEFNSIFGTSTQSATKSSLLVGAGGGYTFGEHWTVRVDYILISQAGDTSVGRFNVDLATAGVTFTF
jgi:opacity protein-like surface antigen